MKTLIIVVGCMIALAVAAFIPAKAETIVIIKSQITENRPFAGVINDHYVGDEVCIEYWLAPEKCPDTAYYLAQKSLLGTTISLKDITP
jgi:hypothetical protein